jgi:hypothetical protein
VLSTQQWSQVLSSSFHLKLYDPVDKTSLNIS